MVRSVIDALVAEVEAQPKALGEFGRQPSSRAPEGSIFVGAGDSYAAALAAFYAARGRCIALDPYALASDPGFSDGKEVYFISASGRTSSNILAAKKVSGHAKRTTALTASSESGLAEVADRVLRLPMAYLPRTPGMLSFSLSLLAVLKMVTEGTCDFLGAMREARRHPLEFSGAGGTTYILGNSLAHPAALYAAAKTYEVLGTKAHPELLEEFSHLELFSLAPPDVVDSFTFCDPSGTAQKLSSALKSKGFEARVVESWGRNPVERLFHAVFQIQLSVLREARARRLAAPRFLDAPGALETSDEMIY